MILAKVRYEFQLQKREFMAIILGEFGGKMQLIDDKNVSETDANKLRRHQALLSGYTIPNQIRWIKENCPEAYKGYKEIYSSRISILTQYEIKSL